MTDPAHSHIPGHAHAGVADLVVAIADRQVSPVELVAMYLDRIGQHNARINAFVTLDPEGALASARASEARIRSGQGRPLEGVPLAIKDDTVVAGLPTSEGSRMVGSAVTSDEAHLVARLRAAGAVIVGKTNLPEFGATAVTESARWPPCRNPWDLSRTPGGSSGGSAAAVAAGLIPAAHGDDGGGSLRIPASCCGVFTLKPSRGRISVAPYGSESPLTVHGFLTTSVIDNALLLDLTHGHVAGDPFWAPDPARTFADEVRQAADAPRLRVGWTTEPPLAAAVHPACGQAVREFATLCAELGHHVEEFTPAWSSPTAQADFMEVWSVLIGSFMQFLIDEGADLDQAEPHNRAMFEQGRRLPATTYVRILSRFRELVRRMLATWQQYDVILTPTLAQPPLEIGQLFSDTARPEAVMEGAFRFTPFTPLINVSGQPAASIPFSWYEGLPIGVQVIGREGDEATVLSLASQIEAARPWALRHPPGF